MSQIKSNDTKQPPTTTQPTGAQTPWSKTPASRRQSEDTSPSKKGFDPYNSGVFDARKTWEKVIRK